MSTIGQNAQSTDERKPVRLPPKVWRQDGDGYFDVGLILRDATAMIDFLTSSVHAGPGSTDHLDALRAALEYLRSTLKN